MNYYSYTVRCLPEEIEMLIALLTTQPFEAFEELEDGFYAYITEQDFNESVEEYLKSLQSSFEFSFEKTFIPYKNWNEEWEKNFSPVQVGNFCGIRADFHPPMPEVQHELVINPKMAFGTGHHETTHMMVELMEKLDFSGKKVLDFGCGTGILAILAARLNAATIDAVDIESESYLNTIENAERNDVTGISTYQGSLEAITGSGYDIILANINRGVILKYLPALYQKLKKGGLLAISGFLKQDEELLLERTKANDFQLISSKERGKWICQLHQR